MTEKEEKRIMDCLNQGEVEQAEAWVDEALGRCSDDAMLYYLKGKICMKKTDWRGALTALKRGTALQPDGPAAEACQMVEDILAFYNKDMYNP